MTAAHLVLVWEERDDPNLLWHAERAKGVGRNPHIVEYRRGVRSERVVLRLGGGRAAGPRRPRQVTDAFGESAPWTVGVEEEVMILDASTLALVPAVGELVEAASGLGLDGTVKTELFASVVELTTGVCADAEEATAQLTGAAPGGDRRAADVLGLRIAAAGMPPVQPARAAGDRAGRALPNLRRLRRAAPIRRQGVSGLHVHVGMPDGETCYRVLEGILPWLPLVLALSANSPYLSGRGDRAALVAGAQILGLLPRSAAPPACGSYEGWLALVERFTSSGLPVSGRRDECGGTSGHTRATGRSRCGCRPADGCRPLCSVRRPAAGAGREAVESQPRDRRPRGVRTAAESSRRGRARRGRAGRRRRGCGAAARHLGARPGPVLAAPPEAERQLRRRPRRRDRASRQTSSSGRRRLRYARPMATRSDTIQVSGIRCERCVARLGAALTGHEGLEAANANLMGQVSLSWDDERTTRDDLLAAMARAGFRELEAIYVRVVRRALVVAAPVASRDPGRGGPGVVPPWPGPRWPCRVARSAGWSARRFLSFRLRRGGRVARLDPAVAERLGRDLPLGEAVVRGCSRDVDMVVVHLGGGLQDLLGDGQPHDVCVVVGCRERRGHRAAVLEDRAVLEDQEAGLRVRRPCLPCGRRR